MNTLVLLLAWEAVKPPEPPYPPAPKTMPIGNRVLTADGKVINKPPPPVKVARSDSSAKSLIGSSLISLLVCCCWGSTQARVLQVHWFLQRSSICRRRLSLTYHKMHLCSGTLTRRTHFVLYDCMELSCSFASLTCRHDFLHDCMELQCPHGAGTTHS